VPCSGPHQAYTFQVVELEGGASTPPPNISATDLGGEADHACSSVFETLLPGVGLARNSRVLLGYAVEPQKSWGSGPLWARCDIVEGRSDRRFRTQRWRTCRRISTRLPGRSRTTRATTTPASTVPAAPARLVPTVLHRPWLTARARSGRSSPRLTFLTRSAKRIRDTRHSRRTCTRDAVCSMTLRRSGAGSFTPMRRSGQRGFEAGDVGSVSGSVRHIQ
jgi:hypothetical protein